MELQNLGPEVEVGGYFEPTSLTSCRNYKISVLGRHRELFRVHRSFFTEKLQGFGSIVEIVNYF